MVIHNNDLKIGNPCPRVAPSATRAVATTPSTGLIPTLLPSPSSMRSAGRSPRGSGGGGAYSSRWLRAFAGWGAHGGGLRVAAVVHALRRLRGGGAAGMRWRPAGGWSWRGGGVRAGPIWARPACCSRAWSWLMAPLWLAVFRSRGPLSAGCSSAAPASVLVHWPRPA